MRRGVAGGGRVGGVVFGDADVDVPGDDGELLGTRIGARQLVAPFRASLCRKVANHLRVSGFFPRVGDLVGVTTALELRYIPRPEESVFSPIF